MRVIQRAAVLGAGTMGSRIAAHFANAGVPALLLDIPLPDEKDRNAAARKGLEAASRQKPSPFFTDAAKNLVEIGNFEDDLPKIAACDWVIEAIIENLDAKRALWRQAAPLASREAILSTNTSGIPLAKLAEGFPPDFGRRFFGTHFFNPPRYLHLVELIPGPATDPALLESAAEFCDRRLGKGCVPCKDTPNFIANRIGSFFGATAHKIMVEDGYTVEEVDELTGPLIGLPRSASFRLLDIVGLDIWAHVARNLFEGAPGDPWRERFIPPAFIDEMIRQGRLGEKTGQGFYRRAGRSFEAIDWKTLEYHPRRTPELPSVETAKNIEDLPARLRFLVQAGDRAGRYVWKLLRDLIVYAAEKVPEISDRTVEIDRAMRWGYAFRMGPFELWDALGFEPVARRIAEEGRPLPAQVSAMLSAGAASFYRPADFCGQPQTEYFDLASNAYRQLEERPGIVRLDEVKRARGVVRQNAGASLIDLGDGALCLEFHSKMNAIGDDALRMIHAAVDETARNFEALVIANQGEAFSAGANLMLLLLAAEEGDWDQIDFFLRSFQQANMTIRCAPKPVVAAPFGHTLGGGAEIALHAARMQASAELYMGLVEAGVGLIPAGGGTKEMLIRLGDAERAFELIGYAKVSASAADARRLGLLAAADGVTMNPERLLGDAKQLALSMAPAYLPGHIRTDIPVGGEAAYAALRLGAWLARQGEYISDYDLTIAEKLAYVLSGGRLTGRQTVSEQYLLDLEREAFLSLCGNEKTRDRIRHMLKTGKPLRN
ncbi:MAG: enoyl-CoA hydratase/isomerase family protein [Bryobacteraceae bacterium]|nr:enoyl-CoA hydratase/isomerase family protein [Bryobacteraceae bacterium]